MNRRVTPVTIEDNHWGMYEHFKPAWAWLKKNLMTVTICCTLGYAFGYHRAESTIELDCKYAKSIRLSSNAFRCERII